MNYSFLVLFGAIDTHVLKYVTISISCEKAVQKGLKKEKEQISLLSFIKEYVRKDFFCSRFFWKNGSRN